MTDNTNSANVIEAIREALSEACSTADAKTVIGEPIVAGGTTLIPVSKVSVGVGIGGGTYGKEKLKNAGGGGTGVTVTPVAFISIEKNGETKLLAIPHSAVQANSDTISNTVHQIDKALENVPSILEKLKKLFGLADTLENEGFGGRDRQEKNDKKQNVTDEASEQNGSAARNGNEK